MSRSPKEIMGFLEKELRLDSGGTISIGGNPFADNYPGHPRRKFAFQMFTISSQFVFGNSLAELVEAAETQILKERYARRFETESGKSFAQKVAEIMSDIFSEEAPK